MKSTRTIFAVVLALPLAALACNLNVNLPEIEYKTTDLVTEAIQVPVPAGSSPVDVTLNFGAGQLNLAGGSAQDLISGSAAYNVPEFKPILTNTAAGVELSSGELEVNAIPRLANEIENTWNLQLGNTPMNLDINAGAYQGRFDLGGLSLTGLDVADGAADVEVTFAAPNPVEMETLRYSTGASQVKLEGLGNANFKELIFRGGAGSYTVDFGETVLRDANIDIEIGISSLRIVVPETANVRVIVGGGLSNVTADGAWTQLNDEYRMEGTGPSLVFDITMGAGNLELRTP
ncbi:MAG TPA: toast rack family protein [Anaerolineales bacterium]|nr:toast rack family protein [Anaerolineales bacterium]